MRALFLSFLLIFTISTFGQEAQVHGTITNTKGEGLENVAIIYRNEATYTDQRGQYTISIPANKTTKILFTLLGYGSDSLTVTPNVGEIITADFTFKQKANVLLEVDVVGETKTAESSIEIKPRELEFNTGPLSTVEGLIKTLPGVVSRSEFSSQYSVRGGSFDENLVYVNGIEVYRPFLARSGQQEGLSFVNPDMVSNIFFSAGGFAARYGDKMSSVLDITYLEPEPFGVRFQASLLGGSITAEGRGLNDKLGVMGSVRYRTNQLLLGSTDLTADYQPRFTDVQTLITYQLTDELHVEFLGSFAKNNYRVIPQSSTTKFGTLNEALQLNVSFDGMEQYFYTTAFGAAKASWKPERNLTLDFIVSGYQTVEQELTDVIGYYRLGELNNNLGSDDFGDVKFLRGVGGYQSYLRNRLDAIVTNVEHKGTLLTEKGAFRWGLRWEHDDIIDRYKEWERVDSAGYSVPHTPSTYIDSNGNYVPAIGLPLFESYDTRASVISDRFMGYLDYEKNWRKDSTIWRLLAGIRSQYWTYNNQVTVSPRATISYTPGAHKNMTYRFSWGYYHQPPFYREFRDISGTLNPEIRAQEAIHYVAGMDWEFTMWKRPFKFVSEAYYKKMNDLIPFSIDNVRVRYAAENSAVGYAAGIDLRLNGEFVKGTESWPVFRCFG